MAHQLLLFMLPEDERAFVHMLEPYALEAFPRRIPEGYEAVKVCPPHFESLPPEALYLALPTAAPVLFDKIKRGPDKGKLRINEMVSPVIFWERCLQTPEALFCGQLWAELEVRPETGRRKAAPDIFRTLYLEVESRIKKSYRRGHPKGYWVGKEAARAYRAGRLKLLLSQLKPSPIGLAKLS
ncbi:MAG: hypothetical protein FWC28_06185 [Proteobacteria bacterium]|nr:hypothetical protein [Cystobacterineae bacterium]MCL2259076.1 hypothetical protein [Cystobacterineae bacterium]MCL2314822.1 hypothetical protein [Pseudomonadota bacterium]